jgi:tRNA (mo5U34)-methyltransferase
MDINSIKEERKSWFEWKNIKPLKQMCDNLPQIDITNIEYSDYIKIESDVSSEDKEYILDTAKALRPWRKGPFDIVGIDIDSEWRSNIKYNLLEPYFDLKDKHVADIGCNNGYYMFRMLTQKPKSIVGFDPSPLYKLQFDFVNHFIKSDIEYELLGIEHLEFYDKKFDTVFCLGVLYHRSDPVGSLKSLAKGINKGGELFLDTFMIDGDDEIALTPKKKYSKIPNIYFIPTIPALKNWLHRAGFEDIEVLEVMKTESSEQRKTEWIQGESLEDFCDPNNPNKTVEGYPAPKRVYVKAIKK